MDAARPFKSDFKKSGTGLEPKLRGFPLQVKYSTGVGPHIRSKTSVPAIFWQFSLSFIPLGFAAGLAFKGAAFLMFVAALAGAVFAELAAAKLFDKKAALQDGSSVFYGLITAALLPVTLPGWVVFLSGFLAVFLGKELFGGLGQHPFHPALVGAVGTALAFPELFVPDPAVSAATGPAWFGSGGEEVSLLALVLGGLFLILRRLMDWAVPIIYFMALGLGVWVFGKETARSLSVCGLVLIAFYGVTDMPSTPMTRAGGRYFAFGCGLLTLPCAKAGQPVYGPWFALLLMNAVTPWIDSVMRLPVKQRQKRGRA